MKRCLLVLPSLLQLPSRSLLVSISSARPHSDGLTEIMWEQPERAALNGLQRWREGAAAPRASGIGPLHRRASSWSNMCNSSCGAV